MFDLINQCFNLFNSYYILIVYSFADILMWLISYKINNFNVDSVIVSSFSKSHSKLPVNVISSLGFLIEEKNGCSKH